MADFAASVITLANASLVVIETTVRYIKEIKMINDFVRELLRKLKKLHRLVKIVALTYQRLEAGDRCPSSLYVGKILKSCQGRLERLKLLVHNLAAPASETWMQKLHVKRQSDKVRTEIEKTIMDIHNDMEDIRTGLSCWSLEEQQTIRRLSEVRAGRDAQQIRGIVRHNTEPTILPFRRTLSEAETVVDPDSDLDIQLFVMPELSRSLPSERSILSPRASTPPQRSDSMISIIDSAPIEHKNAWDKFHFHIAKCGGDEENIEKIRNTLEQHSESSMLAKSTDNWDRTPLHIAAQRGNVDLARILVNFGADINAKDSEPASVLDLAVEGKHRHFVAFLLDQGVDENVLLDRNTARFKEMKRAIRFQQQQKTAPKKNRRISHSTQVDVIT